MSASAAPSYTARMHANRSHPRPPPEGSCTRKPRRGRAPGSRTSANSVRQASYIPRLKSKTRNSCSKNPRNANSGEPAAGKRRLGTTMRSATSGCSSSRIASSFDRAVSMSVLAMRLSSRGRDGASASTSCGGVDGYSVASGSTNTNATPAGRIESTASGSGRHSRRPGSSAARKPVRASDTAIRRGALSKMPPSTYLAVSASDARHTPGVAVSPATHVRGGCARTPPGTPSRRRRGRGSPGRRSRRPRPSRGTGSGRRRPAHVVRRARRRQQARPWIRIANFSSILGREAPAAARGAGSMPRGRHPQHHVARRIDAAVPRLLDFRGPAVRPGPGEGAERGRGLREAGRTRREPTTARTGTPRDSRAVPAACHEHGEQRVRASGRRSRARPRFDRSSRCTSAIAYSRNPASYAPSDTPPLTVSETVEATGLACDCGSAPVGEVATTRDAARTAFDRAWDPPFARTRRPRGWPGRREGDGPVPRGCRPATASRLHAAGHRRFLALVGKIQIARRCHVDPPSHRSRFRRPTRSTSQRTSEKPTRRLCDSCV